jgi:hypothetical protein
LTEKSDDENKSAPLITWCKLTVSQAPIDLSIKFPERVTVKLGEKLKLSCLLSRKPTLTALRTRIKMLKDNKPIEVSLVANNEPLDQTERRYQLVDNADRQITFQIEQSELNDAGKYTLVLDQTFKTSSHVDVVVEDENAVKPPAPPPPSIVKDLSPVLGEYLTTEPFSLFVVVDNASEAVSPADLQVEWFHDGKRMVPLLNQLERVPLENGRLVKFLLNFATPFVFDSGKYQCTVSSPFGQVTSQTASLLVRDPSTAASLLDDEEALFQTKPRFIEYFSDVYVEAGQRAEAQFKCKIIGKPSPKVVWHFNCHKISAADTKFDLINSTGDDYYTLVVKNVSSNDEGEYTCKASNCKGETSWSANLYLSEALTSSLQQKPATTAAADDKENMVAPSFLRKIRDTTVGEGGIACFDCFVDGAPFPTIKWLRNGSPVDLSKGKYELDVEPDTGRVSLTILKCSVARDDAGEYTVRVENAAGESASRAHLHIEAPLDEAAASKAASKGRRKVRFSTPTEGNVFLIPGRRIDDEVPRAPGEPAILDFKLTTLVLSWPQSASDLAVYGEADGQVQQYSDDNRSPVTYLVELRSSRSHAWSLFAASVHGLRCEIDGLVPGLAYSFRVRAENSNGCSDASPVVTTKSLTNVPPVSLELAAPVESHLKLGPKVSVFFQRYFY